MHIVLFKLFPNIWSNLFNSAPHHRTRCQVHETINSSVIVWARAFYKMWSLHFLKQICGHNITKSLQFRIHNSKCSLITSVPWTENCTDKHHITVKGRTNIEQTQLFMIYAWYTNFSSATVASCFRRYFQRPHSSQQTWTLIYLPW